MGATLRSETRPSFAAREMPDEIQRRPVVSMHRRSAEAPKVAPADAQYTCPMILNHPRTRPVPGRSAAWRLERMVLRRPSEGGPDFTRRMWILRLVQSAPDRPGPGGGSVAGARLIGHQMGQLP